MTAEEIILKFTTVSPSVYNEHDEYSLELLYDMITSYGKEQFEAGERQGYQDGYNYGTHDSN